MNVDLLFFISFILNIYVISCNGKKARIDEDCLQRKGMSLTSINEDLTSCQTAQNTTQKEPETASEIATAYCNDLQTQSSCFGKTIEDIWDCLGSDAKTYYKYMTSTFDAAVKFDCTKKGYQNQLTAESEKCKSQVDSQLEMCETAVSPISPWPELSELRQPNIGAFSSRDCRKKGLWVYCALDALDDCQSKDAQTYFKGHYSAILSEGPCKKVISSEFPALFSIKKKSFACCLNVNNILIFILIVFNLQYFCTH